jgi:hypothetical protein
MLLLVAVILMLAILFAGAALLPLLANGGTLAATLGGLLTWLMPALTAANLVAYWLDWTFDWVLALF